MGKLVSVVSGKGGTGKSTFSAGISISLAKSGKSVLLVDLDIGLRSLDIMLGLENNVVFDIGDILDDNCKIDDAMVSHQAYPSLKLLCSPLNITKSFVIPKIIELINSQKKKFDYIILDLPAGLGLSVIMAKALADLICVVTTPDAVTIRDTRKVCDVIDSNCDKELKLVINRVSKTAIKLSGLSDLDEILDTVGAPLLGILKEDEWINNSFAIRKVSKSSATQTHLAFDAMAQRIGGKYVPLVIKTV